jgi:hypothetical protein
MPTTIGDASVHVVYRQYRSWIYPPPLLTFVFLTFFSFNDYNFREYAVRRVRQGVRTSSCWLYMIDNERSHWSYPFYSLRRTETSRILWRFRRLWRTPRSSLLFCAVSRLSAKCTLMRAISSTAMSRESNWRICDRRILHVEACSGYWWWNCSALNSDAGAVRSLLSWFAVISRMFSAVPHSASVMGGHNSGYPAS